MSEVTNGTVTGAMNGVADQIVALPEVIDLRDRSPRVSVVMIVLDGERFIAEAMASVLAQTAADLELLVVDDGSTDGTAALVATAGELDARVRLLHHPDGANHGMSASRNLGIAAARADLVAFLDADDVWEPTHLAEQLAALEAHPDVDMVCAPALYWRSWNDPAALDEVTPLAFPPGAVVRPPGMLSQYLRRGFSTVPMCSLLVRRATLEAVGGAEDDFRTVYEDAVLLSKLHLRANGVVSGRVTARYRQHPSSACARAIAAGEYHPAGLSPARRRYLEWLEGYVVDVGADEDRGLRALIAHELAAYRPAWLYPLRRRAERAKTRLRDAAPPTLQRGLRSGWRRLRGVEVGSVRFGALRRVTPISRAFGYDRGQPIDRHYIETFLDAHADDVRGRVLEVGDDSYTRRFGGPRVTRSEVLHIDASNPRATFVGDLAGGADLPDEAFDCVVLTQTLQLVEDLRAGVATLRRILRPGGTVLATVPGISQVSADEWAEGWLWSFTTTAVERLFGAEFGPEAVEVRAYGNVLAASSFLHGLAAEDLRPAELDFHDPQYSMLVAVRASKPAEPVEAVEPVESKEPAEAAEAVAEPAGPAAEGSPTR